jgi:alpha-D-ribose 1-methylphosphonate 5-triphosphate synthase subunit PhnG
MFKQVRSCLLPAPKTAQTGGQSGLKWLLRRKKAALRRLFNSWLRITSWRQQLEQRLVRQLEQQQVRRQEQQLEQQRQQLVLELELVQQLELVQVLERLLSCRKQPG